jgi:uncharacterized protein YggE
VANNQRMEALQGLLKERGIAAKDIQTAQFAVQPVYSQPPPYQPGQPQGEFVPNLIGYQVQVTVRDLTKLGLLLDSVVANGANYVYGVSLHSDDETLLYEALRKAMADARKKAELLAGEAGLALGPPLSIREETSPYYGNFAAPAPPPGAYAMAAPAASVPVAPGEQETSVTVSVVYEVTPAR